MAKTEEEWAEIRKLFRFDERGPINFANMALASNPLPVREAMDRHRRKLDAQPWVYLKNSLHEEEAQVCVAASRYFGVPEDRLALITGTTLGLALMYGGIKTKPGQEILTTDHEFPRALEVIKLRAERQGTAFRRILLMPDPSAVTTELVLSRLKQAICSHTRVLALTWVYSNSGVKLPVQAIGDWLRTEINARRPNDDDKVLLCIDGVHGFGIEGTLFQDLNCDFFVSGCHKWVFGPRGTGIWCGTDLAWNQYAKLVPTSSRMDRLGLKHTPGGVQAYEHFWALEEAFKFLMQIGRKNIASRVHELVTRMKEMLSALPKVTVVTPMSPDYSAGIICLDIEGVTADDAVKKLFEWGIVATASSADEGRPNAKHLRLSVAMYTTDSEIDTCVKAIASL
jgi:selenocysteine lyase/cysteine desulfurase